MQTTDLTVPSDPTSAGTEVSDELSIPNLARDDPGAYLVRYLILLAGFMALVVGCSKFVFEPMLDPGARNSSSEARGLVVGRAGRSDTSRRSASDKPSSVSDAALKRLAFEQGGQRASFEVPSQWEVRRAPEALAAREASAGTGVVLTRLPALDMSWSDAREVVETILSQSQDDMSLEGRATFSQAGLHGWRLRYSAFVAGEHRQLEFRVLGAKNTGWWVLISTHPGGDERAAAAAERVLDSFLPEQVS